MKGSIGMGFYGMRVRRNTGDELGDRERDNTNLGKC